MIKVHAAYDCNATREREEIFPSLTGQGTLSFHHQCCSLSKWYPERRPLERSVSDHHNVWLVSGQIIFDETYSGAVDGCQPGVVKESNSTHNSLRVS